MWAKIGAAALSAGMQYLGGREQRQANTAISQKQMDFQERMYRSRYQMQMEDMKRAGLNPILSYSQGPPGPPSGAGIQAQDIIGTAANSAKQTMRLAAELKIMKAQAKKLKLESLNLDHIGRGLMLDNVIKTPEGLFRQWETDTLRGKIGPAAHSARMIKERLNPFNKLLGK